LRIKNHNDNNNWIKKFYKATEESKLTVIVMNSEYTNIQTFGYGHAPKVLKGGQSLKYGKSVSLELKKSYSKTNAKIETVNGEEMMTEVMIEYTAKKNKLGAPMRTVSTMLNVNREVRQTFKYAGDVLGYATKFGIINKTGSWFKMIVNGEEKKFQGADQLSAHLENDVDLYTNLKLACYAHIYQPFEFYFHFDYLKKKLEKENQLLKEDKKWELKYMEDIDDEQKEAGYELLSTPTDIRSKKIDQFLTELQIEQAQEELGDFYGEERMELLRKLNFCEETTEQTKKIKKEKEKGE
jgi:hypothetical protein